MTSSNGTKAHRWRAIVTYEVNDTVARALASPGSTRVPLADAQRDGVGVGCIDCEEAYLGAIGTPKPKRVGRK